LRQKFASTFENELASSIIGMDQETESEGLSSGGY
jgi:hypothetical protein